MYRALGAIEPPLTTKVSAGKAYRIASNAQWVAALEAGLSAFVVKSIEQKPGALVAHAAYEITPPEPMGLKKTLMSWEWEQRVNGGHGIVVVPPAGWNPNLPLNQTEGTVDVWATDSLEVASSLADPNKPGFTFVLAEPAAGWTDAGAVGPGPGAPAGVGTAATVWRWALGLAALGFCAYVLTRKN